jgi:hypothetical protein
LRDGENGERTRERETSGGGRKGGGDIMILEREMKRVEH